MDDINYNEMPRMSISGEYILYIKEIIIDFFTLMVDFFLM